MIKIIRDTVALTAMIALALIALAGIAYAAYAVAIGAVSWPVGLAILLWVYVFLGAWAAFYILLCALRSPR
jgi:hypothetical protein